jgi:hypothetical protein
MPELPPTPDLERTLARIGRDLDWPETPDLAASVTARLRTTAARPAPEQPPRRARLLPPPGLRRALVLALVSLLVLAGTVFAAVPSVRDAVLEFFGLQGATVERLERLPTPPPERPLDLGTRTTLDDATERLAFDPLVPADPGDPDGVYVRTGVQGGELSLTYAARLGLPRARTTRLGLLVSEFRGDLSPEYFGKLAGPASVIERLTVDGERAVWIEGAEHFFFYRAPDGNLVDHELRLAQNVLLLERSRLLVRLEGAFERERAIEIARSLR